MSEPTPKKALLICDACAGEWRATGYLDALDESENEFWPSPLFFARKYEDECPECGSEDWTYEDVE